MSNGNDNVVPTGNGKYDFGRQRNRARWIFGLLLVVLAVGIYAYLAVRSDPLWWPFASIKNGGDVQRFQWLFASAVGTFLYLLWEAHQKYTQIEKMPDKVDFLAYTPWYVVSAIRGPIVALVVMFALVNISLNGSLFAGSQGVNSTTTGNASPTDGNISQEPAATPSGENRAALAIGIDLREADQDVLAVIAFLLGFFNRLPFHLLKQIARGIFRDAYSAAYPQEKKKENEGEDGGEEDEASEKKKKK